MKWIIPWKLLGILLGINSNITLGTVCGKLFDNIRHFVWTEFFDITKYFVRNEFSDSINYYCLGQVLSQMPLRTLLLGSNCMIKVGINSAINLDFFMSEFYGKIKYC